MTPTLTGKRGDFWTDPRWGSVVWSVAMTIGIYRGSMFMAVFAGFWAGASVQMWLAGRKTPSTLTVGKPEPSS